MGKVITDKPIKFEAFKSTVSTMWNPSKGLEIKEFMDNVMFFMFHHELDLKRVLGNSPWSFMGQLIVLKQWEPEESPEEVHY